MEGIEKQYGNSRVLAGVSLSVATGEVLGLLGDNGAGKSTLMKVLAGAVAPDAGSILVDGRPVRLTDPAAARQHGIEMVYQDLALCDSIDVSGNLFLGREPVRRGLIDRANMHERARSILDGLGIRIPNVTVPVKHLSGGQRQAVAIARAITFAPRVLIMDEPTSALGVKEVRLVLELIRRVRASGVAVILITHRLQDVFEVCDRIVVMFEGQVFATLRSDETTLEEIVSLIMGIDPRHKVGA